MSNNLNLNNDAEMFKNNFFENGKYGYEIVKFSSF
jgi:hypothetical protein